MMGIIYNTRELSTNETGRYVLDFYVSGDIHFSHFGELNGNFFTSLHFALRVMY